MSFVGEARKRLTILVHGEAVPIEEKGSAYPDMAAASAGYAQIGQWFKVEGERHQIHGDMHRMDKDDEICKFALDTLASRSVGYPDQTVSAFTLVVQEKPGTDGQFAEKAQPILNDCIERLKLRKLAWEIIRHGAKWGNEFRNIQFETDGAGNLVRVAKLAMRPEHTMWPAVNKESGDQLPGYFQRLRPYADESKAIRFEEYEVAHFSFGDEDGYLGTPLLVAARRNFKRLNLAEDVTAAARLLRAFAKNVHRVPVDTGEPIDKQQLRIDKYKANMMKRNIWDTDHSTLESGESPTSVNTDMFIPDDGSNRGGVEMLDPENSQLQNIKDIEHFLNRLIVATTVPKRYFPFEGSTPKLSEGGGNAEDVNFACTLLLLQQMLQEGYSKIFDIELALHGIDPRSVQYVFRMAPVNTPDLLRVAQTDLAKIKAFEVLAKHMPGVLDVPEVTLREYTSLTDKSVEKLLKAGDKLTEGARDMLKPKEPAPIDPRTTLPGAGNSDARGKV